MNVKQKTPETNQTKLKFIKYKKKLNEVSLTKWQTKQALALIISHKAKTKKDLTLSHSTKTKNLIQNRAIKNRLINQYNKPI